MKKLNKKSLSLDLHTVRALTDDAAARAGGGGDKLVIKPSIQSNCLTLFTCGTSCNVIC
jgi:hypothetical protein